jgi:hypothetical protein
MEPPYSRHSFEVESNPDYPDKLAFAPSPISKATILLTNEILVDSYTNSAFTGSTSANIIIPSLAIVEQIGFLSNICTEKCHKLAANLIYENWQEQDFFIDLTDQTTRLNRLSQHGEKIKVFNYFFRKKKYTMSFINK